MEKPKVYIFVEGGIVQYCATNSPDIEVVKIDVDKDSEPILRKNIVDDVLTKKEFLMKVNRVWAEILEKHIGNQVDVEADNEDVHNDFRGTLLKIKKDSDRYFYAQVEDMEGNIFDTDVENVTVPEE